MIASNPNAYRILVLGATGTIGRDVVRTLLARGYEVICLVRPSNITKQKSVQVRENLVSWGAEIRDCEITSMDSLKNKGFCDQHFDAVVSCLASRTGEKRDTWAIDYQANMNVLALAKEHRVKHMILLSAICVQKPRLEFQFAKLKFENSLKESGLTYSIVRPTAYFKSLSGQIARLQQGRPFYVFGNGRLTSCKPISAANLAEYIANCLVDISMQNKILPIGGPGPAITPIEQGKLIFKLLGRKPKFKHVPLVILKAAAAFLAGLSKISPSLATKAELARIGLYYATESMLLFDAKTGTYSSALTPETGDDTLSAYYQRVLDGSEVIEYGEHSVFKHN